MKKFSPDIIKKLKWYVYLLSDPNSEEIFYVGKGKGNRVFDHFKNLNGKDPKTQKIKEIKSQGNSPKIEFLIHGIEDENTIKRIESSIIDLIDKKNLTNKIGGYESSDFGRMDLNQIIGKYSSKKVDIVEKVLLIKLSKTFRYNMSEIELYDYTRGIWIVSEDKRKEIDYVFCVYDGIIQETYKVLDWFPGGSTYSVRHDKEEWKKHERWEFVGNISNVMRKKYRHKSVSHYFPSGSRNPVRYTF
tara:strand:- start:54 stop:788 length:735 start_codon:yes stop_codon:yes gene_type:complete